MSTGTLFLEHVRGRDFLDDGNVVIAADGMPWKCRKSARRIRSTFADQLKGDTEKACVFSGDARWPQTKLSASVRAWSCLLGLSRVGDEDHCGVTRRNFAVSVLRPRVVAIDPAAGDAHAPCIPGGASTNRFPGFSREALAHIGQPSCRSSLVVACQSNRHATVCA